MPKKSQKKTQYQVAVEKFMADHWYEHPEFTIQHWIHDATDGNTRRSYRDWVLNNLAPDHDRLGQNMFLHIFAGMVSNICLYEPGTKWTAHPCDAIQAAIEVRELTRSPSSETTLLTDRVWDSIIINGENCGNRCGGVRAFTNLVCQLGPTVVQDIR